MPVYPKGEAWRVRIWWKGRRQDWIVPGTKRDAKAFEAAKRVELAQGEKPAAGRVVPTFERYCAEQYLPHVRTRVRPSTLRTRLCRLEALAVPLGNLRLSELDPALPGYQDARLAEGLSRLTVNDEIKVLRTVVNHARAHGLKVPPLTTRLLSTPKRPDRVKVWTADEVRRLLAATEERMPHFLPLLLLALLTGMRPGETFRLRMASVDFDAGLLWVERSESWTPKDSDARAIPISDELRPWLERRRGETWFVVNPRGAPYRGWPKYAWAMALEAAGLTGNPHMCRHTFASTWLANGGDLFTLSRVLGHADVKLTQDTYGHLIPGHLQASRNIVSFGPAPKAAAATARERWGTGSPGNRTPNRTRPGKGDS